MVMLIENQIHRFLKNVEEARCKIIEEGTNSPDRSGKPVKRREVSKPWSRLGKCALCQNVDLLLMVSDYDYDLSDAAFQNYCEGRGVLHVAGESGSALWMYMSDHHLTKNEYIGEEDFRFSIEVNGKVHEYTEEELDIGWKIMKIGRAKLQDCWEIYAN